MMEEDENEEMVRGERGGQVGGRQNKTFRETEIENNNMQPHGKGL